MSELRVLAETGVFYRGCAHFGDVVVNEVSGFPCGLAFGLQKFLGCLFRSSASFPDGGCFGTFVQQGTVRQPQPPVEDVLSVALSRIRSVDTVLARGCFGFRCRRSSILSLTEKYVWINCW